jgi:glutamate-5-semialdehyde dehydrogenase
MTDLNDMGVYAKKAARILSTSSSELRDKALITISKHLLNSEDKILEKNAIDIENAEKAGQTESFIDRLLLTSERLQKMASDTVNVASLPDPIGEVIETYTRPNGMDLTRKRIPLGVIGIIYESRPNITVDISALCLKSGNVAILRGGSESFHSNMILTEIVQNAMAEVGLPKDCVQIIKDTDRNLVGEMLQMDEYIDLMIPRGGIELVSRVSREASMPAITGGVGVCHIYVDSTSSIEMATEIVYNAKVQRPSVCNALDTLIIESGALDSHLPSIANALSNADVEMRCDERSEEILKSNKNMKIKKVSTSDWDTEHLSLIMGIKVVDSIDEALDHIFEHSTGHSESIITENQDDANKFLEEVDSSAVMVNASIRLNDGGEFGLGAEVAVSTGKVHARGPMGLKELTSYKWIVIGNGQLRD